MLNIKRIEFKECLTILIILLIGIEIGVLSVYFYELKFSPIIQMISLINPSAPSDYINQSQIIIYPDQFCVLVNDSRMIGYANSGSMRPTLDFLSNGIEVPVNNESDIHIGDIISYERIRCNNSNCSNDLIVHRIVDIQKNNNETLYIFLGDNNFNKDKPVKFKDIKYKTIALLYVFFSLERFIK